MIDSLTLNQHKGRKATSVDQVEAQRYAVCFFRNMFLDFGKAVNKIINWSRNVLKSVSNINGLKPT